MIVKYISGFIQNIFNISDLNYIRLYFILISIYFVFLYFYFENYIPFYLLELITFYNELNSITVIYTYNFNHNSVKIVPFVELNNLSKYINNTNIFRIDIILKKKNSRILNIFKNIKTIKKLHIFNHTNNNNIFRNFNKNIIIDKLFFNLYKSYILDIHLKNLNVKTVIFNNLNLKDNINIYNFNYIPNLCRDFEVYNFNLKEFIGIKHNYLKKLVLINSIINEIDLNIPTLKELNLQNNGLINFNIKNSKLKKCNLKNNYFENLNFDINHLEYLNIEDNNFVVLPKNIINIRYLFLNNNPIIPILNDREIRYYFENNYPNFFENNPEIENEIIYDNEELVHDPYIHKKIVDCINEIESLDIDYDKNINKYMKYFNSNEKKIIRENLKFKNKYSNTNTNYYKLFYSIMYLIKKNNNFDEILKILKEDIINGKDLCYTGVMSKLLNSIMGFNIINNNINISKSDQIFAKFCLIKKKINDDNFYSKKNISKFKNLFRKELEDMNLNENEIKNWLEPIYNSSDESD